MSGVYRIGKRFTFEAGLRLTPVPSGRHRPRMTGDSYTVEAITTADELSGPGFVVDFAALNPLKKHLTATFDHCVLNDVLDTEPTNDNLANVLFDWCSVNLSLPTTASLEAVRISNTPRTSTSTTFTFNAAHRLGGLPAGHKCGREHGHRYTVEAITTVDEVYEPGFLCSAFEPLKEHLAQTFHDHLLNDVLDTEPTSENLAKVLFDWCSVNLSPPTTASLETVRISETASTWAEYRPAAAETHTNSSGVIS